MCCVQSFTPFSPQLKAERDEAVSSAESASDELDELRRDVAARDAGYDQLLRAERDRHEEALQTVKHEGDVVVRMVRGGVSTRSAVPRFVPCPR